MTRLLVLSVVTVALGIWACDHQPPTSPDAESEIAGMDARASLVPWEGRVIGGGFLLHRGNCAHLEVTFSARLGPDGAASGRMLWRRHFGEGSYTAPGDHTCVRTDLREENHVRITQMLVSRDGTRAELCGVIVRSNDPTTIGNRETIAIVDGGPGGLDQAILNEKLSDCDPDVFDPPPWAMDPERFDVDEQGVFEGPVWAFDMQEGDWIVARR